MQPLVEAPYTTIAVQSEKGIHCACVYQNFRGCDIEMACAIDDKRSLTKGALSIFFSYPFNQLNCVRVTTIVSRRNKASRRFVEKLGFKLEGVVRKVIDGKTDAIIYGMLRSECRWIPQIELRKVA